MLGDLVWGPGSTSVLTLEGHEYIQCFDLVVVVVVSRVSTCVETHLMMCFEYRVLCQLYPNKVGLKKKTQQELINKTENPFCPIGWYPR